MKVLTSPTFDRYAKKLHPNEKKILNKAVLAIRDDPILGDPKIGDLEGFYIYKYQMKTQLWLLAYTVESDEVMTLRLVGPHENFYRTLKKI